MALELDKLINKKSKKNNDNLSDEINTVAIIGQGNVGRSLTWAVAGNGIGVTCIEKDKESAIKAEKILEHELDLAINHWRLTAGEKRSILSRAYFTSDLTKSVDADLIIETVTENFELKKNIFKKLDDIVLDDVIYATNSSALSITELAAELKRPENFIGIHLLSPVLKVPIFEVIRGMKTSDQTFNKIKSFAKSLNKKIIEIKESPGFVTTRVIMPMLNEAMYVLMEGVTNGINIDKTVKFGYDMNEGPLTIADRIGLDKVLRILEILFKESGEQKYRPCPILKRLVRAGYLGKKTNKGFFIYDKKGNIIGENDV
ncbi:MAG: 3-hydroxyacyl-CoA dehydrogenase NAD-binding domain-containing protein [Candidatus Marinimicrobia bacterium]|nr:3-hydroxyacyl-CoA dehydrogenase NAD-binding domain-containing protein [Candidatus Neomarinimicrobiota bacterium]